MVANCICPLKKSTDTSEGIYYGKRYPKFRAGLSLLYSLDGVDGLNNYHQGAEGNKPIHESHHRTPAKRY